MARRRSANYLGTVPRATGTGPKNLAKSASSAFNQVRARRSPGVRRAGVPSSSPARASAGYGSPPGGGGGGTSRATTPMAGRPANVTKAKSRPAGRIGMNPRADFPAQI